MVATIERDSEHGFEVEYRVVRPDGSIRWIRDRGFPVKDELGRFYRIAGIAEESPSASMPRLCSTLRSRSFEPSSRTRPIKLSDTIGNFVGRTSIPQWPETYGLPAEALTGKPIGSVIQDAGLDVKEDELAEVRQRIADVFDTGKSYEYEITWPMPTGRKYYSVRLFPELDLNGSVINVLGIARDITERKQAEEKLKQSESQLAEAQRVAHVGYWERNIDTGEISWSDETYRIFGLQPQEPIATF